MRATNGVMNLFEENNGGFTGIMQNLEYNHAIQERDFRKSGGDKFVKSDL